VRQVRALVVDDDPLFTKLLASWLETKQVEVITASSAEVALAMIRSQALDVLITDLTMEGLGGSGLIRALISGQLFPVDRIIVITGESQSTQDSGWLTEQNIPILRKPFSLKSLQQMVDLVLQRF